MKAEWGSRSGEEGDGELRGVERGGTFVRMYCMREELFERE